MSVVRRTLFLAGAAVAVAAVVVAGTQGSSDTTTTDNVSLAAAVHVDQAVVTDQLREVLTPASKLPTGTQIQQWSIADAVQAQRLQPPPDVVISPAVCTNLVDLSAIKGWVQTGTTPTGHIDISIAGTVPGGFDLAKLRANAAECKAGTVTLPKLGISGTISLTEFTAPAAKGFQTVGITQVVNMPGNAAMSSTSSQVYMTDGDSFAAASCADEPVIASENALEMQSKAVSVLR